MIAQGWEVIMMRFVWSSVHWARRSIIQEKVSIAFYRYSSVRNQYQSPLFHSALLVPRCPIGPVKVKKTIWRAKIIFMSHSESDGHRDFSPTLFCMRMSHWRECSKCNTRCEAKGTMAWSHTIRIRTVLFLACTDDWSVIYHHLMSTRRLKRMLLESFLFLGSIERKQKEKEPFLNSSLSKRYDYRCMQ
jgi:hypothetical protein